MLEIEERNFHRIFERRTEIKRGIFVSSVRGDNVVI